MPDAHTDATGNSDTESDGHAVSNNSTGHPHSDRHPHPTSDTESNNSANSDSKSDSSSAGRQPLDPDANSDRR